jgi:phosphoribosylanthranilate isomerase
MSTNRAARVKFCGLTREQDVHAAIDCGAHAVGLVCYPPSPRYVTLDQASKLARQVPAFVDLVALVVDVSEEDLQQIVASFSPGLIQFHGSETPDECQRLASAVNRRWIKALRVNSELDVSAELSEFMKAGASSVLLDAYHPTLLGGTGHTLALESVPQLDAPWVLAGGLNPDNAHKAYQAAEDLGCYALDVSSGIESAPGIKDERLMRRFMQAL